MPINRVPVQWNTGPGGAGVSVFYSNFGVDMTVELGTFFNAIRAFFPTAVSWSVPSSGDILDEVSGLITGAWIGGTPVSITGSGATAYAAGTGCYVRWQTAGIANGRRVKGRTFLVPLLTSCYQTDGTIFDSNLATMQTASTALANSGKMRIWHRPSNRGANNGNAFSVTAAIGPDRVTSLRSRRT